MTESVTACTERHFRELPAQAAGELPTQAAGEGRTGTERHLRELPTQAAGEEGPA